jgi:hypothetical protein
MQRLAQRDGAPASAATKPPSDFFSKFAADPHVPVPPETEASLGAREDRPLFVTTVNHTAIR